MVKMSPTTKGLDTEGRMGACEVRSRQTELFPQWDWLYRRGPTGGKLTSELSACNKTDSGSFREMRSTEVKG